MSMPGLVTQNVWHMLAKILIVLPNRSVYELLVCNS